MPILSRRSIGSVACLLLLLLCRNEALGETAPSFRWADKITWYPILAGYGMALDDCGNVYLSGLIFSTFSFGNTTFDQQGMLLAKCDRAGNLLWAVRDGTNGATGIGLGLDGAQNIYVLVSSHGQEMTLAGSTVTGDVLLAKYDQNGHGLWAKAIVPAGYSLSPIPFALSVDPAGNSYWSFFFSGDMTFGPTNVTAAGNSGALVKCDSAGDVRWVRVVASPPGDLLFPGTPGIDSAGHVYLPGHFHLGASFGTTNLTPAPGATGESSFLAKYNDEGDLLWVRQSGPGGNVGSDRLTIDPQGNCLVQIYFDNVASFGGLVLSNSVPTNYQGIVKYSADGEALWAVQGCQSSTRATLATDAAGNCYFESECGDGSTFFAKYDPAGNTAWTRSGPPLTVLGLRTDALGYCYALGQLTTNTTSFDSTVLSGVNPNNGVYLAKLDTTTAPPLNIAVSNGFVTLSWPVIADGFYLQSRCDFNSGEWTSNSIPSQIIGSLQQLTVPAAGPSRFFRLKRD
jgi:hypothetical protein